MGRKKTGTLLKTKDGRWQPQITLADGSRKRLRPFPKGTSEEEARRMTARFAAEAAKRTAKRKKKLECSGAECDGSGEPATDMRAWLAVWHENRVSRGLPYAGETLAHYDNHIGPGTRHQHVVEWDEDLLRDFVVVLDTRVRDGLMSAKMASLIWGTTTKICADACRSKLRDLRVRKDNPSTNVEGPDRGEKPAKVFLFPSEYGRFLVCELVPLNWRQLVAINVGLFLRPGETIALRWEDVDLEHGVAHIHKAFDRRRGVLKATKNKVARHVPIEPALLPLLEAMADRAGYEGPVIHVPQDAARPFRRFLLRASVDRHDLHSSSPTSKRMTFCDCRATGITWQAVRGDDPLKIMQRAGHLHFSTTMGYIRTAEQLHARFGEVFPKLPESLIEASGCRVSHANRTPLVQVPEIWRKRTGIEPAQDSRTAPHRF